MKWCCLLALVSCLALAAGQTASDDAMVIALKNVADGADENLNLDPDVETSTEITAKSGGDNPEEPVACTMEDGNAGVCVKYYLCDQDSKTVIEDGYTIIDVRAGGGCAKFLDVCCQRNQVVEDKITEMKVITTTVPAPVDVVPDAKVMGSSTSGSTTQKFGKCGISTPGVGVLRVRDLDSPDNKIYADFGEYPWMVAILKRSQNNDEWKKENYIGGGTIIHPSVVMTVAHKVSDKKPQDLKIRAGDWDTNSFDEEYDYQEKDVAKIVVHQHYFRASLYNDVALLFLASPIEFTDQYPQVGIACLDNKLPPPNTRCFSMGWGAADFNNKAVYAPLLKKVKLPLLDTETCETMLRKTRLGRMFRLHNSLVCAGGESGVDTCRGDGGSSLVCPIFTGGTRFAVYGMVAYGISCGGKDIPGVYVNVPTVYDWVVQQVAAEGLETDAFKYK